MFLPKLIFAVLICSLESIPTEAGRSRRQSDSTTEVVGLSLNDQASRGDYETLKKGAQSVSRRRIRQAFDFTTLTKPFEDATRPITNTLTYAGNQTFNASQQFVSTLTEQGDQLTQQASNLPGVKEVLTAMQQIFGKINFDFRLARRLQKFIEKENNPVLNKMVVTERTGVQCSDVCRPDGNGFGTIGICTDKFCTCDFKNKNFDFFRCESSKEVFDPLQKKCNLPNLTVLCSDDDEVA